MIIFLRCRGLEDWVGRRQRPQMGRSLPKGWRHRPSPPAWQGGPPKLRPQNGTRPDLSRLLDRPLEACTAEASRSLCLSKRPLVPESRVEMDRAPEVSGGRPCFLCSPYFFLLCSGGHDFQALEKGAHWMFDIWFHD